MNMNEYGRKWLGARHAYRKATVLEALGPGDGKTAISTIGAYLLEMSGALERKDASAVADLHPFEAQFNQMLSKYSGMKISGKATVDSVVLSKDILVIKIRVSSRPGNGILMLKLGRKRFAAGGGIEPRLGALRDYRSVSDAVGGENVPQIMEFISKFYDKNIRDAWKEYPTVCKDCWSGNPILLNDFLNPENYTEEKREADSRISGNYRNDVKDV